MDIRRPALTAAGMDAVVVESGINARQSLSAILAEGDAVHRSILCRVECRLRRRADHLEGGHGGWPQRERRLTRKLESQLASLKFDRQEQAAECRHLVFAGIAP